MNRLGNSLLVIVLILASLGSSSCNRSSCPTFDDSARVGGEMPKQRKSTSGVIPKDYNPDKQKKTKTQKKKATTKKKKWE